MFTLLRNWLFELTLLFSALLHLGVALWFARADFQPPEAFTPQQGKVSIRLRASIEAAAETVPLPEVPPELRPEPLPIVPELQPALSQALPAPQPVAKPPLPKKEKKRTAPVDSVASQASQASEGAVDQLPQESVNPAPPYPEDARAAGQQGRVWVRLSIDITGKVSAARISESCGYPSLDQAALETVRRWVFHPARRNGRPVAYQVDKPFDFSIRARN
jgi:protein TonB